MFTFVATNVPPKAQGSWGGEWWAKNSNPGGRRDIVATSLHSFVLSLFLLS